MTTGKSNGTNHVLILLVVILLAASVIQGIFLYRIYRGAQTRETIQTPADTPAPMRLTRKPNPPSANPPSGKQPSARAPSPFGRLPFDPDDFRLDWNPDDWDPLSEFQRMQERMNRMFDDSFRRFRMAPGFSDLWEDASFAPRIDLEEKDDRYVVTANIPGAEQSDITVHIQDRLLTISGRIDEAIEEKEGDHVIRKERRSGEFKRTVTLPGPVKADEMTAEYENGVLRVTVPKGEEKSRSKTITM